MGASPPPLDQRFSVENSNNSIMAFTNAVFKAANRKAGLGFTVWSNETLNVQRHPRTSSKIDPPYSKEAQRAHFHQCP